MAGRGKGSGWGPQYRITATFRVPLDFAFAWCTDYTPQDGALEGEAYQRKIIERTPRRIVFEDLEEMQDGWFWGRDVVTLHPPDRWHMDGVGNRRDVTADYKLTSLPDGRTRLELRWRRRARTPGKTLTKTQREASARLAWKRFGAAMERDFRSGQNPGARRTK